ncbi:hypothetical protein CsatA_008417 [Cannabis sativa]
MAPKRTRNVEEGSSSNPPPTGFDRTRFGSIEAHNRFVRLKNRAYIEDRGIEFPENPLRRQPRFETIRAQIERMKWGSFVDTRGRANVTMACEFLANWPDRRNGEVKVRGKKVPATADAFNVMFSVPDYTREEQRLRIIEEEEQFDMVDVAETVGFPGLRFHDNDGTEGSPNILYRCEINPVAKTWLYFVSARLVPNKHFSDVQMDRLKYVYAIMKGYNINIGQVIRQSIDQIVQGATGGGFGLAGVITELCGAYEVPQLEFDNTVLPLRKMDIAFVNKLKEPHPYGQPPPDAPQGRRRQREPSVEEEEEEQTLQLPGPIDPTTQYTHAQLSYIIQQNNHMQQYMVQRSIYDEGQVQQLNSLINRMNIGIDDPNYLAQPPRFYPYDQPPPPNPF